MTNSQETVSQRIDKWLWCARFYKTRSLAGKAVSGGGIRLTRNEQTQRVTKASFCIQSNDTLAFTKGERLFIIRINDCATRRGPAPEARLLYEDLSPPPPPKEENTQKAITGFQREKGTGRPTKKDRRELDKLKSDVNG